MRVSLGGTEESAIRVRTFIIAQEKSEQEAIDGNDRASEEQFGERLDEPREGGLRRGLRLRLRRDAAAGAARVRVRQQQVAQMAQLSSHCCRAETLHEAVVHVNE